MLDSVKCLFKIYEDMVKLLLVLEILFHEYSNIAHLYCDLV